MRPALGEHGAQLVDGQRRRAQLADDDAGRVVGNLRRLDAVCAGGQGEGEGRDGRVARAGNVEDLLRARGRVVGLLSFLDQQQIVRVDEESKKPIDPESRLWLFERLGAEIAAHDAVIIEDYAKGLIDQELVSHVIIEAKKHNKIVAIDPNPNNPFDWTGGTVLKPNRKEAFQSVDMPYSTSDEAVLEAGTRLQKKHGVKQVLITLGEAGMLLLEQGQKPYHTPTRAQDVFDVSGAGDTAIAAFTLALAAGASGVEAAEIANHAAGVVVGKLGTATLNVEELRGMFAKTEGAV